MPSSSKNTIVDGYSVVDPKLYFTLHLCFNKNNEPWHKFYNYFHAKYTNFILTETHRLSLKSRQIETQRLRTIALEVI